MLIVYQNTSEIGNENGSIYFGLRRPQNHVFLFKTNEFCFDEKNVIVFKTDISVQKAYFNGNVGQLIGGKHITNP